MEVHCKASFIKEEGNKLHESCTTRPYIRKLLLENQSFEKLVWSILFSYWRGYINIA